MPREGVPYPERMLCSLKCELKNIWNALNGKLHSVNGVEGDGQGNVNIVSGDAAVTVTPQPLSNQVEISLDRSQLPSAAVTSVNGETGAVVLDASEIDSGVLAPGNSVQDDIGSMYTQVQGINSGLTGETAARANADSALQTNINASNLRISNIENAVSAGPDPDTIGVRDANGRLKAADPASGATDKTLVTANWISQTGDSAPNNVAHRTGNENVIGTKKMSVGFNVGTILSGSYTAYTWYKIATLTPSRYLRLTYNISLPYNNSLYMIMDAAIIVPRTANPNTMSLIKMTRAIQTLTDTEYLGIAWDGTNFNLYIKTGVNTHSCVYVTAATQAGEIINANGGNVITPITPTAEDPTTQLNYVII